MIVQTLIATTTSLDTLILDRALKSTINTTATATANIEAMHTNAASTAAGVLSQSSSPSVDGGGDDGDDDDDDEIDGDGISQSRGDSNSPARGAAGGAGGGGDAAASGGERQSLGDALAQLITKNRVRALSLAGGFGVDVISELVIRLPSTTTANSDAAGTKCRLEELDVSDNKLGDGGVSVLTTKLRANNHLQLLLLDNNHITFSGWQALHQVFARNSTLCYSPFPWTDYHRALAQLPEFKHAHLRHILTDIQRSLARNGQSSGALPRDFSLLHKNGSRPVLEVPYGATLPLASIPLDMPAEPTEDPSEFTFDDEADGDCQTELELEQLKNIAAKHKESSTRLRDSIAPASNTSSPSVTASPSFTTAPTATATPSRSSSASLYPSLTAEELVQIRGPPPPYEPPAPLPREDDRPPAPLPREDDRPPAPLPRGDDRPPAPLPRGDDRPPAPLPREDDRPPAPLPPNLAPAAVRTPSASSLSDFSSSSESTPVRAAQATRDTSAPSLGSSNSSGHLSIGEMLLGVTSRRKFIEEETDELLSDSDDAAFLDDFEEDDDGW